MARARQRAALPRPRRATVGAGLAERGIGLVYGGGRVGLMGAVADAALAAGGEVIGVIPQGLVDRELAHPGLTELHVVDTLHERKAVMADLADAFIALPGGLGTLEELAEVVSWAQLELHAKPIGLLEVGDYWTLLLAWLDMAVAEGFVAPAHRRLVDQGRLARGAARRPSTAGGRRPVAEGAARLSSGPTTRFWRIGHGSGRRPAAGTACRRPRGWPAGRASATSRSGCRPSGPADGGSRPG